MSEIHSGVKFKYLKLGELELKSTIQLAIEKMNSALEKLPEDCVKGIAGNISTRLEDSILISATGSSLQKLKTPDDFCEVVSKAKDNRVRYYGKHIPSSETNMHLLIYENRLEIDSCIHVHLPNIQKIQLLNRFPLTPKFLSYGTIDLAKEAAKSLGSGEEVILRDHGIVVVGKDFQSIIRKIKQLRNI